MVNDMAKDMATPRVVRNRCCIYITFSLFFHWPASDLEIRSIAIIHHRREKQTRYARSFRRRNLNVGCK